MKSKLLLLFLILFQVPGMLHAEVYCTQKIVQKKWAAPFPVVMTFDFDIALGQGHSEAEAKYNLAQSNRKIMNACEEDASQKEITWCKSKSEKCYSSIDR